MTQSATHREYGEYEAVDGTWQFDLLFYRSIGLDLSRLEDDRKEAPVPLMRRAASYVVEAANTDRVKPETKVRAIEHLDRTRSTVFGLMHDAHHLVKANFDSLSPQHPEVLAWQERNAQKERPDDRPIGYLLNHVDCIEVILVRPRIEEIDPDYSKAGFFPVSRPEGVPAGVEGVANQLVLARPGVTYDI